ncbi:MAG: hypothetical protein LCH84_16710 [Gemmatimonadetes bacterium]|nr:hypothetical protein [Gemmatimonadota bacterium]
MPSFAPLFRLIAPTRTGARAVVGALLLATPAAARAQVGHLPSTSPYNDFTIGQTLSILGGRLGVADDPAGVAPKPAALGVLRYDIGVGGPASLFVRYAASPSTRAVKLPGNTAATRIIATPNVTTHLFDGGLDIALTGKKTWHRLLPSVNGGFGIVSDFASADTGAYRFGTKFSFSYGFSLRYALRSGPQIRVDVTRFLWQYQYPDRYYVKANDSTSILVNTNDRSVWRGNWSPAIGVSLPIFR